MSLGVLRDAFVDCGYDIVRFTSFNNELLSFTIVINGKEVSISF